MSNIEFVKYIPTPWDEKNMGVAVIRIDQQHEQCWKIMKSEDGSGFYVMIPSVKVNNTPDTKQNWRPAFSLSNRFLEDDIKELIRAKVSEIVNPKKSNTVAFNQSLANDGGGFPTSTHGTAKASPIRTEEQQLPF